MSSDRYQVTGRVDFSTAPELIKQAAAFIKSISSSRSSSAEQKLTVDLSQVSDCNSAGLALILEMVKLACANHIAIRFENLPAALLTIAKAYGVESEIRELCE